MCRQDLPIILLACADKISHHFAVVVLVLFQHDGQHLLHGAHSFQMKADYVHGLEARHILLVSSKPCASTSINVGAVVITYTVLGFTIIL